MLRYLLSNGVKYDVSIINYCVKQNNLNALLVFDEFKIDINEETLQIACKSGFVDILLWVLNKGFVLNRVPEIYPYTKNKETLLKIYHEIDVIGSYQEDCRNNKCMVCYTKAIQNL